MKEPRHGVGTGSNTKLSTYTHASNACYGTHCVYMYTGVNVDGCIAPTVKYNVCVCVW